MATIDWPPDYQIKRSKRAKYIRLTVGKKGLHVTLPYYCDIAEAEQLIADKQEWIEQQLQRFVNPYQTDSTALPEDVFLRAIDQVWQVHYISDNKRTRLLVREQQQLVIFGDIENHDKCHALLINWLRQQAKQILNPWLEELSIATNLCFNQLCIRGQQTRWGSCSSEKNINLNYKLIFLPKKLVEHILLHELCHTQHMDHSEQFWNLLRKHDAYCDLMDKQSRRANHYIPDWLE